MEMKKVNTVNRKLNLNDFSKFTIPFKLSNHFHKSSLNTNSEKIKKFDNKLWREGLRKQVFSHIDGRKWNNGSGRQSSNIHQNYKCTDPSSQISILLGIYSTVALAHM